MGAQEPGGVGRRCGAGLFEPAFGDPSIRQQEESVRENIKIHVCRPGLLGG